MRNEPTPGLEIMGFGTLEPSKYMDDRRDSTTKTCPIRQMYCNKTKCALWDDVKKRCGLIK